MNEQTIPSKPSNWLPTGRRRGDGDIVVCFPPAGAGAGFYRDWHLELPEIMLVPVQLPGREERFSEPTVANASEIAIAVTHAIKNENWRNITLLGYSFGALLAFETAVELEKLDGLPDISQVVAIARAAPQVAPRKTVADLADDELLTYVRDLGGIPAEIETELAFLDMLLPILRADFRANDLYSASSDVKVSCPISTIIGDSDPSTEGSRGADWAHRTRAKHRLTKVAGGHFFATENPIPAFDAVRRDLKFHETVI